MTDPHHYTPEEQEEFRPLVQAKLDEAERDLAMLREVLDHHRDGSEPIGQTEGENPVTLEETRQLMTRQVRFIEHLKAALKRIDNKTYGQCVVTGRKISMERLRLVPHATLSIEARNAK